jgi:hypothetical protein
VEITQSPKGQANAQENSLENTSRLLFKMLDLLKHLCLKLQRRVQWVTFGCAQPRLFAVLDDATASPDMNPDSLFASR